MCVETSYHLHHFNLGSEVRVAANSWKRLLVPKTPLTRGDVDLSCDAEDAFNSWCRTKAWDELRSKFHSLYAFGRLLYVSAASILFGEEGLCVSEVFNSVGSRQGCSWGSFFYALAIHPYLAMLAREFPGLLIVAYCDDVHIVGPPKRDRASVLALGKALRSRASGQVTPLQGCSKGRCCAPNISEE